MAITNHDKMNHDLYVDSSDHVLYGVIAAKIHRRPGFDAITFGQPAPSFGVRDRWFLAI
jgi:hypothetical protein